MIRDWFGQDGPLPAVAPPSPRSQVPAEPASTRNTRPLDVLSGIPRRRSPDGASRRGCPHARLKPRDPAVRVQIAGAGAAHRLRRPMAATRPGGQRCCQTRGCITSPDRETATGKSRLRQTIAVVPIGLGRTIPPPRWMRAARTWSCLT